MTHQHVPTDDDIDHITCRKTALAMMTSHSWQSRRLLVTQTLYIWAILCLVLFPKFASSSLLNVELVADGLVAPLDLTFAPNDDSGNRFIVDQNGLIFILTPDNEVLLDEPFLNITDRVVLSSAFDERGLLGFAFHPTNTTKVYTLYTAERSETDNICLDRSGAVPSEADGCPLQHSKHISEFTLASDTLVDASSERILFSIEWPGRKHNGGGLAFGPDGYLYIGLGDGGWVHGPTGDDNALDGISPDLYDADLIAQNLTEYFGKILRIDVDNDGGDGSAYGIPEDNPFVGNDNAYPVEIYAWGFRNPFRISFDHNDFSVTSTRGDASNGTSSHFPFYVSATAETLFESTYKVDSPGNYGWAIKEGSRCIVRNQTLIPPYTVNCTANTDCPSGPQTTTCGSDGLCTCTDVDPILGGPIHDPIIEYVNLAANEYNESAALVEEGLIDEGLGRASLGGFIYRGSAIPWLYGKFVQGDFALDLLDGQIFVAEEPTAGDGLWSLQQAYVFNANDPVYSGFVKSIGQDADGELYAITGALTPTGIIGRVFKIVDGTSDSNAPNMSPTATPPSMTSSSAHRRIACFVFYALCSLTILVAAAIS